MSTDIASIRDASRLIPARQRADFFGVLCSAGCALHCAATPVLISVLPSVSSLRFLSAPVVHQVVAVICGLFVARALIPVFGKPLRGRVFLLAAAGLGLVFADAFFVAECCDRPVDNGWVFKQVYSKDFFAADFSATGLPTSASYEGASAVGARGDNGLADKLPRTTAEVGVWKAASLPAWDWLVPLSPYLSPLGGALLILAHIINIRLNCCASGSGCSTFRSTTKP